nr:hypothetical protein [Listeria fleischmannii]
MLFNGIDNEFFNDGMVAELKAHYKVIDENKEVVTNQIVTFGTQVTYVSKELEKADKLLTATQKVERASAPPTTSDFTLQESKALKDGMGKKQKLLDRNYKKFRENAVSHLEPLISNFYGVLNLLDETVEDLIQGLKNIKGTFEHLHVPFTDLDDAIPILFGAAVSAFKPYQTAIESVKTAVRSLRGGGLNDVLEAYRPYIDTALFEGTQFQNVIALNKASVNIYESSRAVFKDIKYQLSDNKAVAVEALDKLADKIVSNLTELIGQLKRGSIDV